MGPVTPLRQRMIEDMRVRNYSQHTIDAYTRYVARFAKHFHQSPDRLSRGHIRQFQMHLLDAKAHPHTIEQVGAALRFFYRITLGKHWIIEYIALPRRDRKLPVVITREDVLLLLGNIDNIKHRAMVTTAYATGLRVAEVAALQVTDIDSKRMLIRVQRGKGKKERLVPLSPTLLELLRAYWRAVRPKKWLFPGPDDEKPIVTRSIARIVVKARQKVGLSSRVTMHALMHSFATHLLDAGTNLRVIQVLLGHTQLNTTAGYLHVCEQHAASREEPARSPGTFDHLTLRAPLGPAVARGCGHRPCTRGGVPPFP
jgi:integrase/recombinase XerD